MLELHVQAVRAQRQWFAMSLSSPSHEAMTEVPFSALKPYSEYSKNVWRLQQLHLLGDRIAALHVKFNYELKYKHMSVS